MRNEHCSGPGSWKRPAAWVSAGLVYLAILTVAPTPPKPDVLPNLGANPVLVASNNPAGPTRALPWYIRSGQWRADMRSLAAALRYLTDSESAAAAAPTNFIPGKADNA